MVLSSQQVLPERYQFTQTTIIHTGAGYQLAWIPEDNVHQFAVQSCRCQGFEHKSGKLQRHSLCHRLNHLINQNTQSANCLASNTQAGSAIGQQRIIKNAMPRLLTINVKKGANCKCVGAQLAVLI